MAAVGSLSLSFSADRSNAVVNDHNRTAVFNIRALLINPNGAYALLANITATPAAAGSTCAPSTLRVDEPLLIPPGGLLAVDMGAVACNATDAYLYVQGALPVSLNIAGTVYYDGVVVASAAQPVASVATAPPQAMQLHGIRREVQSRLLLRRRVSVLRPAQRGFPCGAGSRQRN